MKRPSTLGFLDRIKCAFQLIFLYHLDPLFELHRLLLVSLPTSIDYSLFDPIAGFS